MSDLSYDELRARLKEAEELINALAGAQADAVVTDKGVHLLRLHETDQALRAAIVNLDTLLAERTRELERRKHAEAALRESEERFRATFFQAAVGIAQTSPDGQWLLVNDRLGEILGYSSTELCGKTFLEMTHPDDREASRTALRQLLAGEISSWSAEKRCICKDGATVWARLFVSVVRDQHNQAQYFIAAVEDITEKVEAERALQESEQRLVLAQSAAHLGVWHREWEEQVITFSEEYVRLYGLAPERTTLTHEEWLSLIHPDDRERVQALVRDARERTHIFDAEFRVLWPDGSTHWQLAKGSVFLDDSGRPIRIAGVNMDITERKQAEVALCESERRYKEVFDNFSECIFVLDVTSDGSFKIAGLNPAEQRAIGLSDDEVTGKFIEDVFPEDFAKRVTAHYRRCLDVGTLIHYNEELNLPIGTRYFHTNLIPVRNDAGRIHRIVGCSMDFTDLKRSQEEAFARQKLESVGTLASGIAHDFNNLLGSVLAQADLALAEFDAGSSPNEELKGIREVAIRGSEIVRQLMIYAGTEAEVVGLVDVSRIIKEMLKLLKVSVSKHAVVETDLGKDLPPVRANATQLRQIVMNLVTNASDAIGDRDGVIRVTTGRLTVGPPEGDFVQLEVSDTGCGMSQEMQARVLTRSLPPNPQATASGLRPSMGSCGVSVGQFI
jgi:two-component system, cell cycle sensor histidine kinase and response regulator CckA